MTKKIVLVIMVMFIILGISPFVVQGVEVPVTKKSVATGNTYTLAWNDEFSGTTLDSSKWYNRGYPSLASVQNGNLVCRLNVVDNVVRRCYIDSRYQFKYGFIEMMAKPSSKHGIDNQFWLTSPGWTFEVDIMEYVPRRQQLSMNAMYRDTYGQHWIGHNEYSNYATGYHLYQLEWTPDKYIWYIDGVEKFRTTNTRLISNVDVKMEIASCGSYGYKDCAVQGIPDQITDLSGLPTDFLINYVRVYRKGDSNFAIDVPKITVVSPNGGESWQRGISKTITWSSSGSPGAYVKIDLYKAGVFKQTIVSSTLNDGSHSWYVPTTQTLGTDYKIKVTSTTNGAYTDMSNNNFAISSGTTSSITVTAPNGGESWQRGLSKTITWSSSGSPGANVKIDLYKAGVFKQTIVSSTPNDGSHSWYVPTTQTLGTDYKIKVTSTSNSAYADMSNNNFIIGSGTSITVTSPNGGESWQRGISKTITWSSSGSPGAYVKIDLYKAGVFKQTIVSSTPNDGSQSWYVPTTQTLGTDYKIKVTSTSNSAYADMSNNNFKIY